jgi:hypothetical protein
LQAAIAASGAAEAYSTRRFYLCNYSHEQLPENIIINGNASAGYQESARYNSQSATIALNKLTQFPHA